MIRRLVIASVVLSVAVCGAVFAMGHMSAQEKEVWTAVTTSWDAIIAEDIGWVDKWVHADAAVWGGSYPMPRSREEVKRWDRYNFDNSQTIVAQFSPAKIVVSGNTAVAHYYYSTGDENREGKRKTTHGRCTDVLVRSGGGWKFIAWHCTDEPSKD